MTEGTGWAAPENTELRAQLPDEDGIGSLSPATGLELGTGLGRRLGLKARPAFPPSQVSVPGSGAASFHTAGTLRQ